MTAKTKISKIKKNTNKKPLKPKANIKASTNSKPAMKKKSKPINKTKGPIPIAPKDDSEEEDMGEQMLEMMDEDDLSFLKSAIKDPSYSILRNVDIPDTVNRVRKRKNRDVTDSIETNYEFQNDLEPKIKIKNLLPIKTKSGIVKRTVKVDKEDEEMTENHEETENGVENGEDDALDEDEMQNSESEGETNDDSVLPLKDSEPITPAQLLITRNKVVAQKKLHIGTLSSGILENPEEKLENFQTLLKLFDDESAKIYVTIKKLVIVALLEVFKDVLPSYEIKSQDSSGVKLKRDTLKLHKYEQTLVSYYKRYLQKLEKTANLLKNKKGGNKNKDEGDRSVAEVAVHAMCDLLIAHPYFNYSENLAQAVVPFLNSSNKNVRQITAAALQTIFKEDKKEEITLKLLRSINHYLKSHSHNVNVEMLQILLSLRIKEVNLDQEKQIEIKSKKLNAHKQNILAKVSKKERKRKKRLQELETELLETKAEENKQTKLHNLTEITKILFGIYFRILKSSSNNKILSVCLEGLAKFAHCINLEFYVDIVNVLDRLLLEDWLGHKEKLHCIQTVFSILGGQGNVLNLDPTRFYVNLYKDLLNTDASRSHANFSILLHTIVVALIYRRKKITNKRIVGFLKRIMTLSLQLLHGSTLGCLAVVKTVMQLSKAADILLDVDNSVGDGKYNPEIEDPEYCNASCTSLYEITPLSKHYNPIVRKYARHIASGVPASGDGSLPPQYGKCSPEELAREFDMSQMAFNPPIPVPRKAQAKSRPGFHMFVDDNFRAECFTKSSLVCEKSSKDSLLFVVPKFC